MEKVCSTFLEFHELLQEGLIDKEEFLQAKGDLLNFLQTSTEMPLRDILKTVERIAFTLPKEEIVEIRRNVLASKVNATVKSQEETNNLVPETNKPCTSVSTVPGTVTSSTEETSLTTSMSAIIGVKRTSLEPERSQPTKDSKDASIESDLETGEKAARKV